MKFLKLTLLSAVFASSFFTVNALALDTVDNTASLIEKCNIIYQNENINTFHKGRTHKACLTRAMLMDADYKDLVTSIRSLEDALYAEKNVLLSIQFAAEPNAKLIRASSKTIRALEKELASKIKVFHTQLLNDEKYANIISKFK